MKGKIGMTESGNDPREDVLNFWFRELSPKDWFETAEALDPAVRARFGALHAQAAEGALADWAETPLGRLALILVLDQFSRHIHRGTALAFASDPAAQHLAVEGIAARMDETLGFAQRQFFYMPLMHAEDSVLQAMSVERFKALRDYAEEVMGFASGHSAEIAAFGRFPGRNLALGRNSSPAEIEHLNSSEPAS